MKRKILIVDDDATILDAFKMAFEDEGFEVQASTNGKPIDKINGERPDVVLLDIMLSGEDGRDLARKVREKDPSKDMTVILVSAMGDVKDSALAAGADYFLPKPVDLDRLIDLASTSS